MPNGTTKPLLVEKEVKSYLRKGILKAVVFYATACLWVIERGIHRLRLSLILNHIIQPLHVNEI